MAAPKRKGPSLDELRSRAKSAAYRVAEANGIDPDAVRHMTDTVFDKPCFVIMETESDRAVVVYDNEPDMQVHIINRPGRLQPIAINDQSNIVAEQQA